jgi:hypothetical protein
VFGWNDEGTNRVKEWLQKHPKSFAERSCKDGSFPVCWQVNIDFLFSLKLVMFQMISTKGCSWWIPIGRFARMRMTLLLKNFFAHKLWDASCIAKVMAWLIVPLRV